MTTVIQKTDLRFERLNISIDNLVDVDRLIMYLRDTEDSRNYMNYSDNDKELLINLIKTCESISQAQS